MNLVRSRIVFRIAMNKSLNKIMLTRTIPFIYFFKYHFSTQLILYIFHYGLLERSITRSSPDWLRCFSELLISIVVLFRTAIFFKNVIKNIWFQHITTVKQIECALSRAWFQWQVPPHMFPATFRQYQIFDRHFHLLSSSPKINVWHSDIFHFWTYIHESDGAHCKTAGNK